MKKLCILFILFAGVYQALSQEALRIPGLNRNSYELYGQYSYIDNLDVNLIPDVVITFFTNFTPKMIKEGPYLRINTTLKRKEIIVFTKQAKNGYLEINKGLMAYIHEKGFERDEFKILYVLNDLLVSDCDSVRKLIKLKERQIKKVEYISPDQENDYYLMVKIITQN